jgi:hypothetical protein
MQTQTKRYKPTKYKISESETQSKTKTQTKLKMIASCKGMNGTTPEEVEIIIGGNNCDITCLWGRGRARVCLNLT